MGKIIEIIWSLFFFIIYVSVIYYLSTNKSINTIVKSIFIFISSFIVLLTEIFIYLVQTKFFHSLVDRINLNPILIYNITYVFLPLVVSILAFYAFFYFSKYKNISSFVKGIWIFTAIIGIICVLSERIILRDNLLIINVELIRYIEYFRPYDFTFAYSLIPIGLPLIIAYVYNIIYIVFPYGLLLSAGNVYTKNSMRDKHPVFKGKKRHIGILILLFIATLGIYFYFWLYKTVKNLKENFTDEIPYTPGRAVGFLFIPVFNFFWMIYLMFSISAVIKKIEEKHYHTNIGFFFHPFLIPIFPIFMIVFTLMIYFLIYIYMNVRFDTVYGTILALYTSILIFWLTIQAKLNSFFELNTNNN